MQRSLRFVDLHFARGKSFRTSPLLQPAPEESLTAAVFTAHGLEAGTTRRHGGKLLVNCRREMIDPHCQSVEAGTRHRTATQGRYDVVASGRTDHELLPGLRR